MLKTAGTGAIIGLAGCTSLTGDGDDSFPSKDVELVVPFSIGGDFDAFARIAQPYLEEHLPNDPTVVVRNVEGSGGRVGAAEVYKATEDGHKLLFWYPSAALPQQISMETEYDIMEMTHVGALVRAPNAMVVTDDAEVDTWDDFLSKIPELKFATQGSSSTGHVNAIMLASVTEEFSYENINFVHYNGTGEVKSGLARGEANAMVVGVASSALDVAQSVDNAEMFTVFSDPEAGLSYADATKYFSSEVDGVNNMDRYAELTQFVRFLTAPPEVPEEPTQILRDAYSSLIEDKDFLTEAEESDRPIVNPGDHEAVASVLEGRQELYSSEPLKGIFEEVFSD